MYAGPPIDDAAILALLPEAYRRLLERVNGYVAYGGGLHVRGACLRPAWHSLREAWLGEHALHRLYPDVGEDDVPFAEDALGDQLLLRGGMVHRLEGESGEVVSLGMDLEEFEREARADPPGFLSLEPLAVFASRGGELRPGELLAVYPPFVAAESRDGVSYRAVPARERILWLADLARRIRELPDGARVSFDLD